MLHDRIMTSIVFYPLKRSIMREKRNEKLPKCNSDPSVDRQDQNVRDR
jgi:hypothetical protein